MTELLLAVVDPAKVKPGWLGLFVVLAIAVALVILLRSMSNQLKKVDFPESDDKADHEDDSEPDKDDDRSDTSS